MDDCVFCAIGSGAVDSDLAVYASTRVFVVPALRQRAGTCLAELSRAARACNSSRRNRDN